MHAVGKGGIAADLAQMAFGNGIGVHLLPDLAAEDLFAIRYGSFLVETDAIQAAQWARMDHGAAQTRRKAGKSPQSHL